MQDSGLIAGNADLLRFWGKAGSGADYHPAVCHMLDVAAVIREYLAGWGGDARTELLLGPLGGRNEAAEAALVFLAACHDIGKVTPGFQWKRRDLAERLAPLGLLADPAAVTDHGESTRVILRQELERRAVPRRWAARIAGVLGSHHGRWGQQGVGSDGGVGGEAWRRAREGVVRFLARVVGCDLDRIGSLFASATSAAVRPPAPWLALLGGLVSFCDWLGSMEEFFPFVGELSPRDLESYYETARQQARRTLAEAGFTGWRAAGPPRAFGAQFPTYVANDLQVAVTGLVAGVDGPALVIIEAPMGLGKTEAALAAAHQQIHRRGLAGAYFALPTQATSNQMFGRVARWIEAGSGHGGQGVELHLLHQFSDLHAEYRQLRVRAADDEGGALRASAWFTARKRGLLAPFAVGTVDQALLSVLATRHFFVRLAGLTGKVVVLDEVHAYDTYVSELLDRLVAWLGALGSTVIVLSATLPAARRRELLAAFGGRVGAGGGGTGYPLVSLVRPGNEVVEVRPAPPTSRRVALEVIDGADGIASLGDRLGQELEAGGCAAWICNTVARAQEVFAAVARPLESRGIPVRLFHARFPLGARLERERQALEWFGKGGPRPPRALLVATQVIEQSLDLDFDLMLTDLAPVDLVLQRAGRLHRHERPRPARHRGARLWWTCPPLEGGLPSLGVDARVYEPLVLWRSWEALRHRGELRLPEDVPMLVDAVYGPGGWKGGPDPAIAQRVEQARVRFERHRSELQRTAEESVVNPPASDQPLSASSRHLEEDEPTLHETLQARTRLTRPSITLVCAHPEPGADPRQAVRLAGGPVLRPGGPPDSTMVMAIRLASVSIHQPDWVRELRAEASPAAWSRIPVLADCRLAVFSDGRLARPGLATTLELDDHLGLVVRRP